MFYEVRLQHYDHSKPTVLYTYDDDREKAIAEMGKYVKKNGYSITERNGWCFAIEDVLLVETERIAGKPPKSIKPYRKIFDLYGNRRKQEDD